MIAIIARTMQPYRYKILFGLRFIEAMVGLNDSGMQPQVVPRHHRLT